MKRDKRKQLPHDPISIGRNYDLLLIDDSGEAIKIDFAGQVVCVEDDIALLLARNLIESVIGRIERQSREELNAPQVVQCGPAALPMIFADDE